VFHRVWCYCLPLSSVNVGQVLGFGKSASKNDLKCVTMDV